MEFAYRPSSNPYWDKIQALHPSPHIALDWETERHAGKWLARFPTQNKVHVEIGCNGGHWLLGQAARNTQDLWIGIDYKFKQIYFGYEKAKKRNVLQNTSLLRANAERLPHIFGPQEIDRLYMFFPDPWPREKQHKHRLFQEPWLRQAATRMKPDGVFEIRTDHPDYFQSMLETVKTVSEAWDILEVDFDLYKDNAKATELSPPDVTLFERVFIREGKPIQRMVLRPRA